MNENVDKIRILETAPEKTQKEVKECLQEWLDNNSIKEIVLLGKNNSGQLMWRYSGITSTLWWIGMLNYMSHIFCSTQDD
jgi:predicted ATP-grasp superfamily ATP-dependent carboligase